MKNRCPEGHGCPGGGPCQEPLRKILTLLGLKVKFPKKLGCRVDGEMKGENLVANELIGSCYHRKRIYIVFNTISRTSESSSE